MALDSGQNKVSWYLPNMWKHRMPVLLKAGCSRQATGIETELLCYRIYITNAICDTKTY